MRYQARETVAKHMRKDVRYLELDFQPPEPPACTDRKSTLSYQCQGIAQG
jgi:hypothetical protein